MTKQELIENLSRKMRGQFDDELAIEYHDHMAKKCADELWPVMEAGLMLTDACENSPPVYVLQRIGQAYKAMSEAISLLEVSNG